MYGLEGVLSYLSRFICNTECYTTCNCKIEGTLEKKNSTNYMIACGIPLCVLSTLKNLFTDRETIVSIFSLVPCADIPKQKITVAIGYVFTTNTVIS